MDPGADTYFIVGHAKTSSDNPITKHYSIFFMAFVVEAEKGTIRDLDASVILPLSNTFIKSLFIGRSIAEEDPGLIGEIQRRYHGTSKKALIVAYKDAVKKFRDISGARG
jgi:hypothetical protein